MAALGRVTVSERRSIMAASVSSERTCGAAALRVAPIVRVRSRVIRSRMPQILRLGLVLITASACTKAGPQAASDGAPDRAITDAPALGDAPGHPTGDAALPPIDGAAAPGVGPYFTTPMFWNRDVSASPKAADSDAIIAALSAAGGWGTGKLQIDFSIDVLAATAATPKQAFTPSSYFYTPDCDDVAVPVPAGGDLEDESGYACTGDGDCHLLVVDSAQGSLYEMWKADIEGSAFSGGCLAVWHLDMAYGDTLRGDGCSSADAAGYPISPLLFTADEVAAGEIAHAIRFILPNDRVAQGYTRPATHSTSTTGGTGAPAYGVQLRLRADYPVDQLSPGAQVVARAMQRYGMYHADGGNIALTAQTDRHTAAKWSGLLGATDLDALQVGDFEVIDNGGVIALGDCTR